MHSCWHHQLCTSTASGSNAPPHAKLRIKENSGTVDPIIQLQFQNVKIRLQFHSKTLENSSEMHYLHAGQIRCRFVFGPESTICHVSGWNLIKDDMELEYSRDVPNRPWTYEPCWPNLNGHATQFTFTSSTPELNSMTARGLSVNLWPSVAIFQTPSQEKGIPMYSSSAKVRLLAGQTLGSSNFQKFYKQKYSSTQSALQANQQHNYSRPCWTKRTCCAIRNP